jgi:diaminohydroxyphosphoribosylaminopyrimidine deaminase/5-amino-6-(5-phosphoribosylamino)uracil reductase
MVGAIVVRAGEVVGEGYHAEWGQAHAEVVALRAAGERARGATLYVTLEPCRHAGKTGPCTRAIIEAGVARVVCAVRESNAVARGGGEWLRAQGLDVEYDVCRQEARDLNAVHFSIHERNRPFVALKYAMSLDARLAAAPGLTTSVTAGPAVVEAHRLRAGHDAVLVGIGTVLTDDPALTVREWGAPRVAPLRVVLDSSLRLPRDSKLVRSARDVPVRAVAAEDAAPWRAAELEALGVEVARVPRAGAGAGLDLGAVLRNLRERAVHAVLCEGGGRLGSALLAAGLVDRLYVFIAPRLFGEPGVQGFQGELGGAAREWRLIARTDLGGVTLLTLGPSRSANGKEQP